MHYLSHHDVFAAEDKKKSQADVFSVGREIRREEKFPGTQKIPNFRNVFILSISHSVCVSLSLTFTVVCLQFSLTLNREKTQLG